MVTQKRTMEINIINPLTKTIRRVFVSVEYPLILVDVTLLDENPRENMTKAPSGAESPRVFWSHFPSGFCQTAIYDQE